MELHFLGTGSAYPSPKRSSSCTALRLQNGTIYLFDCGEGSQIQLQKSTLKPGKISKIFITHLHGDHLFGLPGLLCTIGMNGVPCENKIDIYGPFGLRNFICTSLILSFSILPYKFQVHEIILPPIEELHPESIEEFKHLFGNTSVVSSTEIPLHPHEVAPTKISINPNKHYDVCYDDLVTVKAGIIKHSVPCIGYILEEDEKTGKLNVEYLKSLNVKPGPLYGKLKMGESITLENGQVVYSKDCVGPNVKGKKIAILGDTYNADNVSDLVMNSDILIHESTNENVDQAKSIEHGHSTAGMAGMFAKLVNAKRLVITHFSQRYYPVNHLVPEESVTVLIDQARETFESNAVIAAEDLMIVKV